MTRKELYEEIINVKDFMAYVEYMYGIDEQFIQTLNDEIYKLRHMSIKESVAAATVIACGSFYDNNDGYYSFMLPRTKDCMYCFHSVKKLMNKGKKIPIFVYREEAC